MKRPAILVVSLLASLVACPLSVSAREGGSTASAGSGNHAERFEDWNRPYLELQVSGVAGGIHDDWSAGFGLVMAGGGYGFHSALVAPVRFDWQGVRARDWDEVNDFGRLIGRIAYRNKSGDLDVEVQSLRGYTLGAGNLVSMFFSTVDQDHWRTGISARMHWGVAGADLFVDSCLVPSLFGARAYFRPLWFVDRSGNLGRLEVAGSFATDVTAPSTFGSGTSENPAQVLPDRYGLVHSDSDPVSAWSVDVRWPIQVKSAAGITPWAAWSRIGAADAGQAGIDLAFRVADHLKISFSGEYSYMESGFAAGYFDNLYMADRYDFGVLRNGFPGAVSKQAVLEATGFDRHGGSAGAGVFWDPWLSAWFRADIDQNGMFSRFRTGLTVTVPDRLLLTGTLVARGFGNDNRDVVPDRLGGSVVADVTIWKFIGVFLSYSRDMYVPTSGADFGRYVAGNTALGGLRLTFGLLKSTGN